jgi:hypothetical protein
MSANSKDLPTAAEEVSAAEEQAFRLLNAYWEGLRRGGPTDPQAGVEQPPEGAADPVELQVLAALDVARAALAEDSQPPTPEAWAAEAEELTGRPLLQPGTRLGACRVRGLLGWGGMGEVYLAEHEVLQRPVAIKVLPVHLAGNSAAAERFHHSVCILARLSHPNLAAAYDANVHEGRLYLVMEYVPGVDLGTRVRQTGPLGVAEACGVIRQAAVGLEYLHGQGVVHRDIKPGNLMLTPDGTVKILDLGLARRNAPGEDEEHSLTAAGVALGTPKFMAPEHARDARRADARSDLYSLGCAFYYLLTGRAPFGERTQREEELAHALEEPRAIQEVRPEVPPAVGAVVHKLLAKRPEERYPSARALLEALQQEGAGEPAAGRAPEELPEPRAGAKPVAVIARLLTRQRLWWLLGVAAALLVAGIVLFFLLPKPPLEGELGVEVWSQDGRRGKLGEDPEAVPVRTGDRVQIEVKLNQPAYGYLFWVDSEGKVESYYPWEDRGFGRLPAVQRPRQVLHSPSETGRGWKMEGARGLETILLLARRSPLPEGVDVRELIGELKPVPLKEPRTVLLGRFDPGQKTTFRMPGVPRGTESRAVEIDDELLQLMERLRPHFEVGRAVRFAHQEQ